MRSRRGCLTTPLRRARRCGDRRGVLDRADPAQRGIGGAFAALPGAVDGAPQRLMGGLARQIHAADRIDQRLARGLAAGGSRRHRAEHVRRGVPARRAGLLHRIGDVAAEQFADPLPGEGDHRCLALRREIAAERAGDVDRAERGAADIGVEQGGARRVALLDQDVVAGKPERIAGQLQRDVIVAAEAEFCGRIDHALGNFGGELDVAGGQHIGRHRDDGGARGDPP